MTVTDPARVKGNTAALAHARAETAARKHRDVVVELTRASNRGDSLTVSTLAAAAGVSRQFLYSRPDLMEGLRRHQERHPDAGNAPLRAARLDGAEPAGEIRQAHNLYSGYWRA